ncbi:hypothetical protein [Chitinophaga pinensis]|uniref:Outer membrane protein beta-barrel domain-containing protein n=1 Tax=Chitinophaga pinensis (strain ATCC 43595 / DSM 2588 / LMG 13176 / NBRC 15968 / NCIMB 11800 / UQM 2034) TaxID=485918 RepID=A0A979G4P2_CHIPD|nr:hypothetical protein [Chitinophaga pinensis]ACU60655.1 hypothetical protein Cpin_3188 [Chitinophaga pinensis DSM 2588]
MKQFYCLGLLLALTLTLYARQDSLVALPAGYLKEVKAKTDRLQQQVNRCTEKAITAQIKLEEKLHKQYSRVNPAAAESLFKSSLDSLQQLKERLRSKVAKPLSELGFASPYMDSLKTTLNFLNDSKLAALKDNKAVNEALEKMNGLEDRLGQAGSVQDFLTERKQLLNTELAKYTQLAGSLKHLNKDTYYYTKQLQEYKEAFKDKKKAEAKAMELLNKVPAYKDFLAKHSQLAGLFNLKLTDGKRSVEGLQTRSVVEATIQEKVGTSPQAKQAVSEAMDKASQKFDELKKRFPSLNNAGEMPDFKPNNMKTKKLADRLEWGGNLQFKRNSTFLPTTTNMALQLAYKFNEKTSAGVGLSYALGMGSDLDHIKLSHQGLGLRSFFEMKVKASFFAVAGGEANYLSHIRQVGELTSFQKWQPSALVGAELKHTIKGKWKGGLQVLYDVIAHTQAPRQSPWQFRFIYTKSK